MAVANITLTVDSLALTADMEESIRRIVHDEVAALAERGAAQHWNCPEACTLNVTLNALAFEARYPA